MSARRCSNCNINWPGNERDYDVCGGCGRGTWFGAQLTPDFTGATARVEQRKLVFEAWYESRGEREYVPESPQHAKLWEQQLAYCDSLLERDKVLIGLRDADTVPHPIEE